jgi:UDP-N-acetylmuramoyl-tripeptide--D-alanyl-D-alanine ligase
MQDFTLRTVREATGGKILRGRPDLVLTGISTDTKTLRPGELFFALVGDKHDAHRFVPDAMNRGAGAVVVHNEDAIRDLPSLPVIRVKDTTRALGDLAKWHRAQCTTTTVIGITGSNGKTTVKEMLFHILDGVVRSVKSIRSYNNAVGVPLTLFQLRPADVYAVVEMGTNSPGEIARLCEIADPNVGVLTLIAASHLEGLGSIEGVAREKSALLRHTVQRDGAFYNADCYHSRRLAKSLKGKLNSFGFDNESDLRGFNLRADATGLSFKLVNGPRIHMPIAGTHNAINAVAAIAVARKLGIDWATIEERLATFRLPPGRMEMKTVAGVTVINDAYNANPQSMEAAARTLHRLEAPGKKIMVTADMLELGDTSVDLHRRMGKTLAGFGFDYLLGVGVQTTELLGAAAEHGMADNRLIHAGGNQQLAASLSTLVEEGDVVLLKGSRRMKLEEVVQELERCQGVAASADEVPVYDLYRSLMGKQSDVNEGSAVGSRTDHLSIGRPMG